MKITIIVNDGSVGVDGVSFSEMDLSFIPPDVHAVQVTDGLCEVEYRAYYDGSAWVKPANAVVDTPEFVATAKSLWDAAVARQDALNAAADAAQAALDASAAAGDASGGA
jgi:hypothetical protein